MMPLPSISLHSFFEATASLLETLTDENFWVSIFGERIFELLKRYSGNDAILVGIFLSLGPTLLSILHSCHRTVRNFLEDWLYVSVEILENEAIFQPVQAFVNKQYRTVDDFKNVSGITTYSSIRREGEKYQEDRLQLGLIPQLGTTSKILYKGYTLWVHRYASSEMDRTTRKKAMSYESNEILGMLSASNLALIIKMRSRNLQFLKDLIQEWVDQYYEDRNNQLIVYKSVGDPWHRRWSELCSKQVRRFESVILKETQKEMLLEDLLSFRTQKDWYAEIGIPYRRGYLLYGPPGTGKTSFVQSLASKMHMSMALISLATPMDDDTFTELLIGAPRNSIILMEDIDHCVIDDGEAGGGEDNTPAFDRRVTSSGLLNALDGVYSAEGSVVFLTCNDVNKVVPALLRPGRIDLKMELGYADQSQIGAMFWRFFGKPGNKKDPRLVPIVDRLQTCLPADYLTPAELQNFFMIHAMNFRACKENIDTDIKMGKQYGDDRHFPKLLATLDCLLASVPAFLERVEHDREQARKHAQAKANSKKRS